MIVEYIRDRTRAGVSAWSATSSCRSKEKPAGVVIAVGPLTSVKEQAAGTYAQAMAERGYAALAFDYRYFGESNGQPRQFENPEANIEDIRNAATALLADDRLVGLPCSAWHLLRRRTDGPVGGRGPALPWLRRRGRRVHGQRQDRGDDGRRVSSRDRSRPVRRAEVARDRRGRDHPAVAADGGDVAMPLREAYEFYGTSRGEVSN